MRPLQNSTAQAVFKAALTRDVHPSANSFRLTAPAGIPPLSEVPSASDCVGCSSYLLPVMLRASMGERLSASLHPRQLPQQGVYNRAEACVDCRRCSCDGNAHWQVYHAGLPGIRRFKLRRVRCQSLT